MQNRWAIKWLTGVLGGVALAQALWIWIPTAEPRLDKLIRSTPIGTHSAIYEVLSDSSGATVPLTYLYFIANRQENEHLILEELRKRSPFLITKQADAVKKVEGLKVQARTHDTVYRYTSIALLKEGEKALPVIIELTATADTEQ
ncbi:hypothetical protein RTH46_22270 [Pseudomonas sp. zfem004]|uniref:hypothetical protein n=1 Tax=unclassified Pseudomonas TaxID=196821 RepID=UPI00129AB5BF|nr:MULTISPECIES: hypothetical protein [unclassified Pseudomonas]MDU9405218.1 hypothetical protein [Pseudomonas sp. zfem004]